MRYTYRIIYPNGETEMADETFATEENAREAALYDCGCFKEGREIMSMMGDRDEDIIEGDCDFDIIEIDDE